MPGCEGIQKANAAGCGVGRGRASQYWYRRAGGAPERKPGKQGPLKDKAAHPFGAKGTAGTAGAPGRPGATGTRRTTAPRNAQAKAHELTFVGLLRTVVAAWRYSVFSP